MANRYIELEKKNKIKDEIKSNALKHFNFGFFVYLFILLYLIFCIISFTTNKKVNYTLAEVSSIIDTSTYNGMIIRNEKVYTADTSGSTTFFYPEGAKVQIDAYLVTIDEDGVLTDALKKNIEESEDNIANIIELTEEDYINISNKLRNFMINKDNYSFLDTYYTKYEIEKALNDISNTVLLANKEAYEALLESKEAYSEELLENSSVFKAEESGIISYLIDGYEALTIDNYSPTDLYNIAQQSKNFTMDETTKGQPLLKIVDNYEWYIVAKVDDAFKQYTDKNGDEISIIIEGNNPQDVTVERVYYEENELYAELKVIGSLENYLEKRFLDFTIKYSEIDGIKLPNSAVVEKDFYVVPIDAVQKDGSQLYIKKKVYSQEVVEQTTLAQVNLELVVLIDDYAYIPADSDVEYGDAVYGFVEGMGSKEYTIDKKTTYEGVYIINQGFVEYRPIETLYSTSDYRIIKENTNYGIMMSDRVVIDHNDVVENDFIY